MKKTFIIIISLVALFASAAKGKKQIVEHSFTFSSIDINNTPQSHDYVDASVVIILKEGKLTFDKEGFIYTQHIVEKILNDRGIDKIANVKIPYIKDYSDIIDIKGRTITPDGQIYEIDPENIYDVTDFPDYITYADYKAKRIAFPAVQAGSIVEYIFIQKWKSITVPSWDFQQEDPTIASKFILEVPQFIKYKILKKRGQDSLVINEDVRTGNNGRFIATYTAENIPAIIKEPYMPPKDDVIAQIKFVPVQVSWLWMNRPLFGNSWISIGEWYTAVCEEKLKTNKKIELKTALLVNYCDISVEKAKIICEYVRDNYRYVAIYLGEGGVIPNMASKIFENQYGDCKDLAVLTTAMLRAVDIKANLGLVKTADNGTLNNSFCSYGEFNHVVVCIPATAIKGSELEKNIAEGKNAYTIDDDWLIFDPTAKYCPFGSLPWQDTGVEVLVINGQNTTFVNTKTGKPGDNLCMTTEVASLDSSAINGQILFQAKGLSAQEYRNRLCGINQRERTELYKTALSFIKPGSYVDTVYFNNLTELDSILTIIVKYHENIDGKSNIIWGFSSIDTKDQINLFTDSKRNYAIFFPYPYKSIFNYTFEITHNAHKIKYFTDSVTVDKFPVGIYAENWLVNDKTINCSRHFDINMIWLQNGGYPAVKQIFDAKTNFNQKRFVIEKNVRSKKNK